MRKLTWMTFAVMCLALTGCGAEVKTSPLSAIPNGGQASNPPEGSQGSSAPEDPNSGNGSSGAHPPLETTCTTAFTGRYVVYNTNMQEHFIEQDGCAKIKFAYRCVGSEMLCERFGIPKDDSWSYVIDGSEHEVAFNLGRDYKLFASARYDGETLIIENRRVPSSGAELKSKEIYSFASRPCNLMNPEPGATYLVRRSFSVPEGVETSCDYRKRL